MLDRFAIAGALREISALMALQGGKRFHARAYERGAQALEATQLAVGELVREGRLQELPGIGAALASVITELNETGSSRMLERLRAALPEGVLELSQVPGMTMRRIRILQEALGIQGVADLEAACREGRVRELKGFGAKTEQRLLQGIASWKNRGEVLLLHHADREAEGLVAFARSVHGVVAAELAGPQRRRCETVDRLAVAVAAVPADQARVLDELTRYPPAVAVPFRTAPGCELRLASGVVVDIGVAPESRHAALLLAMTGSREHLAQLGEHAGTLGMELREGLLFRDGHPLPASDEAAIYRQLGLPLLPPETREGQGEIAAALAGSLPAQLLREEDVAGMVHCHTDWSDGRHTIEQMARAADAMGLQYLTITDHSPTAHYAGGLSVDRLRRQWDEIERVQPQVSVRLLRGTESDILPDGSLDFPDHILEQLDVVIASIHNRHQMDRDQMTERLCTMMRLPWFKIWGHALGRYVQSRPPIECDMDAVLDAAAGSRVAIEVNGDPHRLDLEPRWQRQAARRGIPFVVSSDAHSTGQLANVRYAVAMARRGWLSREQVLNTRTTSEFMAAVRPA